MAQEERERIDLLLVSRGLVSSQAKAQAFILAGKVMVDEQKVDKVGTRVPVGCDIRLIGEQLPFVSRGGLKLAHALDTFNIDVSGLVALDVGISTGGFTDCLIQRGVKRIYGVDVGYGQIDYKLRQDERLVIIERTNVRNLTKTQVPEQIDLAVIDVSFISLKLVIPKVLEFLKPGGAIVALVKPQFEVGKGKVGKGGVVRDEALREEVVSEIQKFCEDIGLTCLGKTKSPQPGAKGNVEYFLYLLRLNPAPS
jgi:23S rRNA (cytidine1920-2'-O)/16S rRNA (cytidine1409-2'-O)-methyltransferase